MSVGSYGPFEAGDAEAAESAFDSLCIENEALKVENRLLKREVRTLLDTIKCAGEVLENLVGCTTETQMSNVVQQCKKLGITIGDTIQGREEYGDGWNEARITLLWLGAETAVWSVATRNDRQPRWQQQGEESNWTLDRRDWRKVQPNMRIINDHQVNPANDLLVIAAEDAPGSGGANHRYAITGFDTAGNASVEDADGYRASFSKQVILFQNGPISVDGNGVNGVTHEALLAIVADRLRCFQKGPYACKANACALTHIEEAMHWLQQRTLERMRRGVEGTHAK